MTTLREFVRDQSILPAGYTVKQHLENPRYIVPNNIVGLDTVLRPNIKLVSHGSCNSSLGVR